MNPKRTLVLMLLALVLFLASLVMGGWKWGPSGKHAGWSWGNDTVQIDEFEE